MKPPAVATVGPFTWTIEEVDRLDDFGNTDFNELKIRVRANAPDDVCRETVLHELLHAILFQSGVDAEKQEKWVLRLSPTLFQTLRDNPEIRRFLFGR